MWVGLGGWLVVLHKSCGTQVVLIAVDTTGAPRTGEPTRESKLLKEENDNGMQK